MPASFVKGKEGEAQWERAKEAAKEQYGDIEKSNPDKFYALVMTIYKSMCSKHQCSPKAEGVDMDEAVEPRPVGKIQTRILEYAKKAAEYGRESFVLSDVPWKIFPWDFGDLMKSANALEKKGLINIVHGHGMRISLPKKSESVRRSDLSRLAEGIEELVSGSVESVDGHGVVYRDAMMFFKTGVLPDGSSFPGVVPKFGFQNPPKFVGETYTSAVDGSVQWSGSVIISPGGGGGAGIGIDPRASNMMFNTLGTDDGVIKEVSDAFSEFVQSRSRELNEALRRWLRRGENVGTVITGMALPGRVRVRDAILTSIKYRDPVVDPTRRMWPSSRTEIWIPVTADVVLTLAPVSEV